MTRARGERRLFNVAAAVVVVVAVTSCGGPTRRNDVIDQRASALSVLPLQRVRSMSSGGTVCAVLTDGSLRCWGPGGDGELGNGTFADSTTPAAVSGLGPGTVASVSSGSGHVCAALTDGTARCWGNNDYGQLGIGSGTGSSTPVTVPGLSGVIEVSAARQHSCALLGDGTVRCWGTNDVGQLGNGTGASSPTPVVVAGLSGVTHITSGWQHTCALLGGGAVACWGLNDSGQLGNGTNANAPTPVLIPGSNGFASLSAGGEYTCAMVAGSARCWGSNDFGQLGNGAPGDTSTPSLVVGLSDAVSVYASRWAHTCALNRDGTMACWGRNVVGELGNGTTVGSPTAIPVPGLSNVTSLALGSVTSCAVLGDGTARCWGRNFDGELGIGGVNRAMSPTVVAGLSGGVAISAALTNTCAILNDGTARCWGANEGIGDGVAGQLGNGQTTGSAAPVVVLGLSNVTALAPGESHNCALLGDGTARCWGNNDFGELGNGNRTRSASPVAVSGLSGIVSLTSGIEYSCAALTDGSVRCWGYLNAMALGTGGILTPTVVPGLSNVVSVAAGRFFTCALASDRTVRCWGENNFGQLGNGNMINSPAPVTVSGLSDVVSLVAGENYACAILTDRTARCWGDNRDGELGNGTTVNSPVPVTVSGLTGIASMASRWRHTCAALMDGTARCWGEGFWGQLGNGSENNASLPLPVPGISGAVSMATGFGHTCALLNDGSSRCWGDNRFQQVGLPYVVIAYAPMTVIGQSSGQPCTGTGDCSNGFCVDGMCCDSACGGNNTGDCQACSIAAGASANGSCTTLAAGRVCRARADACDIAESCNGAVLCPADTRFPSCAPEPVFACVEPSCSSTGAEFGGGSDTAGGVDVTFNGDVTTGGTIANVQSGTGNPPGALPTGYKVLSSTTGLYYFDLNTTAAYSGPIVVCMGYAQGALENGCDYTGPLPAPPKNELRLRLLHDAGNGFVDITIPFTSHGPYSDPCANRICGQTTSLSPFVIVQPADTDVPILPNVNDVVAYATTTSGAVVNYTPPTAVDDFDGPVPVACTPDSGTTFAPGRTDVTCTAADSSGNVATTPFTAWVQYQAPTDGTFFLQPINADSSSIFKRGSTIPVKFKLTGASAGIANLVARLHVAKVSNGVTGSYVEGISTAASDEGNTFRYDPSAQQYIFNLSTKSLTTGTWSLRADLGDLVDHVVNVSLK